MCGIVGLMTVDGGPREGRGLESMPSAIAHRGPDGHGRYADATVHEQLWRAAVLEAWLGELDQGLPRPTEPSTVQETMSPVAS